MVSSSPGSCSTAIQLLASGSNAAHAWQGRGEEVRRVGWRRRCEWGGGVKKRRAEGWGWQVESCAARASLKLAMSSEETRLGSTLPREVKFSRIT